MTTNAPQTKICVCVSGGGRSLENLLNHQRQKAWSVAAVVSSSPDCKANKIARDHNIPLLVTSFARKDLPSTTPQLEAFLNAQHIEWIVLAGFLKLFPILENYRTRTINIHPALLPKYGGPGMHGMHVHEAVIAQNEPISGASVHFVNDRYDEGAVIAQSQVAIVAGDSPSDLAAKVFASECQLLPQTLDGLVSKRLPLAGGQVWTMPPPN